MAASATCMAAASGMSAMLNAGYLLGQICGLGCIPANVDLARPCDPM